MDEKFHEQAAALEQSRRDDGLQAARRSLQGKGKARCEDCSEPIPRERRKASPNAIRCIGCQTIFEKFKRTRS
jgi:phage/conjugal plasmid C-4 type zinc finger TraR family protein